MRTARLSFSFRAQFRKRHRRQKRRKLPGDLRSCAAWPRRSASTTRFRCPGSAMPEESDLPLPARRHSLDRQRDLCAWEACGSRWRAKAWSSGQPVRTRPPHKCKPELGRQETFRTAGGWVSSVACAMTAPWFQNSLINYAGERDPLQDTIKVLPLSLSSRAHSGAALARQEQVERPLPFSPG